MLINVYVAIGTGNQIFISFYPKLSPSCHQGKAVTILAEICCKGKSHNSFLLLQGLPYGHILTSIFPIIEGKVVFSWHHTFFYERRFYKINSTYFQSLASILISSYPSPNLCLDLFNYLHIKRSNWRVCWKKVGSRTELRGMLVRSNEGLAYIILIVLKFGGPSHVISLDL